MSTGRSMTGSTRIVPAYQALAEDIKQLGVTTTFGLMSDDTALLVAALDALGVRFFGARHENAAVAMAEGYSAATRQVGVAIIGRGPATANGLHAAVAANRTGSKILIIYGDASLPTGAANGMGPDTKTFNASVVLESAGLRTFRPTNPAAARAMLIDAMAAANQGGAVALLLPTSVQLAEIDAGTARPAPVTPAAAAPLLARAASIEAAARYLEKSRRPLIVGGGGAADADAGKALEKLADRIGAVLATSVRGKDLFHGHPYNLGLIGSFSHSAARRLIDQADCALVFGAGLNQRTSSFGTSIPPGIPLIHVDAVRSHIGRWHHADVAVVADARQAAEQLLKALPERAAGDKPFHTGDIRASLAAFDPASDFQAAHTARTVDPRLLAIELDRLLPKNRNVIWDSGNFIGTVPYLSVQKPRQFKLTADFASVGLGLGTALGYAAGDPGGLTVLMIGDGGLLMTLGELETAVREDIPLVIILMNDCAYGAELHFLKLRQMPVAKSMFPDLDFAPIAEGFGFRSATIRSMADLQGVASLLAKPDGPILLDCKINAAVQAPFLSEGPGHAAAPKAAASEK